jgi:uncharacterized protein YybS (DUF2232 family)
MVSNMRELAVSVCAGVIVTLALYFTYEVFPVMGALTVFLVPFPSMFYTLKTGRKAGYGITAAVALALVFIDRQALLSYLVHWLPLSLLLPELLLRGCGIARSTFITVGIQMLFVSVSSGLMPGSNAEEEIRRIVDLALIPVGGTIDAEKIRQTKDLLFKIYPSCLVLNSGILVLCNLLLLRLFKATRQKMPDSLRFLNYRNRDPLIWLVILSGFSLLVDHPAVESIALNILILVLFMYLIQGLAVVAFFFSKSTVPRFLQPLFYVFLFLQPYLAVAVTACGMFDLWIDFRKPKKKENL